MTVHITICNVCVPFYFIFFFIPQSNHLDNIRQSISGNLGRFFAINDSQTLDMS